MYKNKEDARAYDAKYYITHKEKISKIHREYVEKHREEILAHNRKYNKIHKRIRTREETRLANEKAYIKVLSSWIGVIPSETTCQSCGKSIYFGKRDHNLSIHFDHRRGGEPIQGSPANWLRLHRWSPENEEIWKSCDFGMLCQDCNRMIPTNNRKEFLLKALEYIKL